VFGKLAKMGKSSYGWFMGFKLHLIINNKGEIMAIKITKGNNSDISAVAFLAKGLKGSIYRDKGYISKGLLMSFSKKACAYLQASEKICTTIYYLLPTRFYSEKEC